jgi:hypothetical protein
LIGKFYEWAEDGTEESEVRLAAPVSAVASHTDAAALLNYDEI